MIAWFVRDDRLIEAFAAQAFAALQGSQHDERCFGTPASVTASKPRSSSG